MSSLLVFLEPRHRDTGDQSERSYDNARNIRRIYKGKSCPSGVVEFFCILNIIASLLAFFLYKKTW